MRLSVIIPWRDRPELAEALQANASHLRRPGIEVLVVNGGGDRRAIEQLLQSRGWPGILEIHFASSEAFNKSECVNLGAFHAQGEALFILDADVVLTDGYLDQALKKIEAGDAFTSVAVVRESAPEKLPKRWDRASAIHETALIREFASTNGNTATMEFRMSMDGVRTGPGLVMLQRPHFVEVQGFNSNLQGWGFEDFDLQLRLQLLLGLRRETFGEAIHLTHELAARDRPDQSNEAECLENYKQGRLHGTYNADAARLAAT